MNKFHGCIGIIPEALVARRENLLDDMPRLVSADRIDELFDSKFYFGSEGSWVRGFTKVDAFINAYMAALGERLTLSEVALCLRLFYCRAQDNLSRATTFSNFPEKLMTVLSLIPVIALDLIVTVSFMAAWIALRTASAVVGTLMLPLNLACNHLNSLFFCDKSVNPELREVSTLNLA